MESKSKYKVQFDGCWKQMKMFKGLDEFGDKWESLLI